MLKLKNNIWFIHKPKTGGSSVKKFLLDNGLILKDYRNEKDSNIKIGYFEDIPNINHKVPLHKDGKWVSITRNPIDWYDSYFFFHAQKMIQGAKYPINKSILREALYHGYDANVSFDAFIMYLVDKNYPAYSKAYEYYNKRCEYILNTDTLAKDLGNFLLKEYGSTFDAESKLEEINPTIYQSRKHELKPHLPDHHVSEEAKDLIRTLDKKFF